MQLALPIDGHCTGLCSRRCASSAHRPGSPYCEQNAMSAVRIAARQEGITADELLEIAVDCAWEKAGRPFTKWRD